MAQDCPTQAREARGARGACRESFMRGAAAAALAARYL
jgi:hypothetical protein